MTRLAVLAGLAVGALGLAIGGAVVGAGGVGALGWAAAAGAFLLLMLRGPGLRAMGVLLALLGLGAGALAVVAGGWALVLLVPAALLAAGGVTTARWGPAWPRRTGSGPRVAPEDQWKQFDAGQDPTSGPTARDVVQDTDPR